MKIKESQLRQIISESIKSALNEGAGAAYDVVFNGLKATNFKITGLKDIPGLGVNSPSEQVITFKANLIPSVVAWKANSYYEGVTSDGIYLYGELVDEFDELQKTVNGGEIIGYVYREDVDPSNEIDNDVNALKSAAIEYLTDYLSEFGFRTMYGGGWSHVNLSNPMIFQDVDVVNRYGGLAVAIDTIEIQAEEITKIINWFFENADRLEEIYFGEDENGQELNESYDDEHAHYLEDLKITTINDREIYDDLSWIKQTLVKKVKRGVTPNEEILANCSTMKKIASKAIKLYNDDRLRRGDKRVNFSQLDGLKLRHFLANEILDCIKIDYPLNESYAQDGNYSHFAVNKTTNKVVNGWDYHGYDPEELRLYKKDYFTADLIDYELDPKQYTILTVQGCKKRGIDPFDDSQWANC